MSLFPDEDILTREIESWRGFIDKLPSDEDKVVFAKLLDDCYKYSVAINNHAQDTRISNRVFDSRFVIVTA